MERKLALIVGNDRFDDPHLACLVSPAAEARALADILKAPEIGGFDEVTTLVNEPETQVRRGIASLFARRKSDDLLLLYFSTHGLLDENGRLFLAARDTQRDLLKATSISASFVTEEMDNCLSRRQVLVLDCCHSGAFARGTKGALGASVGTAVTFEGNGFGRWVLTATDSTQYAWDGDQVIGGSDLPTSVFTRHLIEGLRTGAADEDDDGRISLDELYAYIYQQVLSETRRQTPGKWAYKQQGNLIIARNPHPGRKKASIPEHSLKALESDSPSVRERAVRELERHLHGPQVGLAKAAEETLQEISTEDDSRKIRQMAAMVLADFCKVKETYREISIAEAEARDIDGKVGHPIEIDIAPQQAVEFRPSSIGVLRDPDGRAEHVLTANDQVSSGEVMQSLPAHEVLPDRQEDSPGQNIIDEIYSPESYSRSGYSEYSFAKAESIVRLYRRLSFLVGLQSLILTIQLILMNNSSIEGSLPLFMVFFMIALCLATAVGVITYQLARRLEERLPILWALLTVVGFLFYINLIISLALILRARSWCLRYGIRIGFLGPTKKSLEELRHSATSENE
jgi:Caspase domain